MGCGSSSTAAPPESTGRTGGTNSDGNYNYNTNTTTNDNYNTNTNTAATTTTYEGHYPDDNAIYGYDMYNDDDKKKNSDGGGGGGTSDNKDANNMQYDDAGFYGETETEKRDQELFVTDTGTNDKKDTAEEGTVTEQTTDDTTATENTTEGTTDEATVVTTEGTTEETTDTRDKTEGTTETTLDETPEEVFVTRLATTDEEGTAINDTTETETKEPGAEEMAQPSENSNEAATAEENVADVGGDGVGSVETGGDADLPPVDLDASAAVAAAHDKEAEKYDLNKATGLYELFKDYRKSKDRGHEPAGRPRVPPGEKYTDSSFTLYDAITDGSANNLTWKRPEEIVDSPVLFSDASTRYDIGQGSAGTCWFLSTVANIAERPELLQQVIPETEYPSDGVFHARFWQFGRWEDVYTDDCLPIIYDTKPWGAKSATDEREMWVSLLEKAFARFHGSYNAIYGGQPGDAYMALTGGVGERIDFEDNDEKPRKLFSRIKNAINSGAHVTCVVPDQFDKQHGLVGGHAYSLTGTAMAKGVNLLRVRNPWGNTEWTGPWSDESSEWNGVSQDEVPRAVIDDGEFWISLQDFMTYFSQTTICSLTPDFDEDGVSDSLNYQLNVFGEWKGDMAGGFQNRLDNPRILFTVPENAGTAATVVQLIQKRDTRQDDNFQVRCDVYKVLGDNGTDAVLEILGENTNVFNPETQCSFRHQLTPGTYAIVPCTINAGQEKNFLIRVFSSCPLSNVRQMDISHNIMSCGTDEEAKLPISNSITVFGAWKAGVNSGGQISHRDSHAANPQYLLTVQENASVVIHVMQERCEPRHPVGMRMYPAPDSVPMDIEAIYSAYESALSTTSGQQSVFVVSYDVDAQFDLPAGRYVLLLHMDEPDTEKRFAVVVKSTAPVSVQGYNTGE